jgi:serine/threonine protein kinase
MALAVGTQFGSYEIVSAIGAGGMGEVYRARDTKLKREVALKVLPDAFAGDAERMARFQHEAEVLASLNHPNIAHIYGVEDHAIVMELVEGEPPKGPMSFENAWTIAMQIADALEYAHEKGIVHRDLKPANVKVAPDGPSGNRVKLLDFGLAKAFDPAPSEAQGEASVTDSPTLTVGATVAGVILGTLLCPPTRRRGASSWRISPSEPAGSCRSRAPGQSMWRRDTCCLLGTGRLWLNASTPASSKPRQKPYLWRNRRTINMRVRA